ncbi:hypothetical protein BaRGS_00021068, partial [Batillaria attramentaria]
MRDMAFRYCRASLLCLGIAVCVFQVRAKSVEVKRNKRSDDPAPFQAVVDNLVQEMNSLKGQLAAEQNARETKDVAIENKL